jgi:hypothetical protein
MIPKTPILFLLALTLLGACTTTPPGVILVGNLVVVDAPGPASAFVSGQLVVKLKREVPLRAATAELVNEARLRPMATLGSGVHLVRVDGKKRPSRARGRSGLVPTAQGGEQNVERHVT